MRVAIFLVLMLLPPSLQAKESAKLAPVKHIIVVYLENHSFDNLMGMFPGADGLGNAGDKACRRTQTANHIVNFPP